MTHHSVTHPPVTEQMQSARASLLADAHRFCRARGIKYSLCGATALGAVTRGEPLPAETAIDIMMERHDYERFLKEYAADVNAPHRLRSVNNDPTYVLPFARLEDETVQVPDAECGGSCGVHLRIFPVDVLATTYQSSTALVNKVGFTLNVLRTKLLRTSPDNSIAANAVIALAGALLAPFSKRWLGEYTNRRAFRIGRPGAKLGAVLVWGRGLREIMELKWFERTRPVKFMGGEYDLLEGHEAYLSHLFPSYPGQAES